MEVDAVGHQRVVALLVVAGALVHVVGDVFIIRLSETAVVLLESGVAHDRLKEIAADGECRARTLSESARAEVDAAVFAAYPCAANQVRTDAHEPGIGVVVAGAGLAAEVGIPCGTNAHPAVQAHRGGSGLAQSAHHHLLHQPGALHGDDLFLGLGRLIDFAPVFVDNPRHEHGFHMLAVVGNGAIGVGQLEQVHVAGTQGERGLFFEHALDAHLVGGGRDVADAHLLTKTYGNGVDALGEGGLQRNGVAREAAVGIGGPPDGGLVLLLVVNLHLYVFVAALVAGRESLVHGLGIDEQLEGGAGLAHGRHLVVFPRVEVNVAHPGLHMAGLRFHGHESAMHESHHVADAVHGRHLLLDGAVGIVEELHLVGLVQVVFDGVGTVGEAVEQVLIDGQLLHDALDEIGNLAVVLVLPRILRTPMGVEVLLHLLHLLAGGFLGILLHAGVDGGVDFQSAGVEVVAVVLAPFFQVVGNGLAEILGLSVVVGLDAVLQLDGHLLQFLVFLAAQVAVLHHVVHHHVAALDGVLGMRDGVVEGGGLEHAYEHGSLVDGELLRGVAEVGLAGGLDAKGIAAEVDGVGIHRQDLVLVENHLQLEGDNPLLGLHDEHLQTGNVAQQTRGILGAHAEHVLGQLLGDGRGTAGVAVHNGILGGTHQSDGVDAIVLIEAFVLGVDEGLPESGSHLFELHRRAVL